MCIQEKKFKDNINCGLAFNEKPGGEKKSCRLGKTKIRKNVHKGKKAVKKIYELWISFQ